MQPFVIPSSVFPLVTLTIISIDGRQNDSLYFYVRTGERRDLEMEKDLSATDRAIEGDAVYRHR